MIDWEKLLRKARIALGDSVEGSEEEARLEKIIKFCKYKIDSNIYMRKETVIYWDSSEKVEKETKVKIETKKAQNFDDFCNKKYDNCIIKKEYIFN